MNLLLFMMVLAIIAQVFCVENPSGPKKAPEGSGSNDKAGFDFESTTTPSIPTTVPTTSEPSASTGPVSTKTASLNCGPLADTSCCTQEIIECLLDNRIDLSRFSSADGYEVKLEECGCVLTTTSTTTNSETPITPSNSSSCGWLATSFNLDAYTINGGTDFSYNGTCCSDVAVNTLKNENEWGLSINSTYSQWDYLVNLLYCVEGACTDPPRWDNCSMSSTSSSSSTSPQTSTSSEMTTSSGQATDSTIITTDGETSSTPSSTAATTETRKGDNNDETTTMTTTSTGSTSETKTTTDVESSSETTSTKLSLEGSTETRTETKTSTPTVETTTSVTSTTLTTGNTETETTFSTTTTASSEGSTTNVESTTFSTSTTDTTSPTTGTTGNIMTTSEGFTTPSTSTTSSTPTISHTSITDTTETTMTTPTASTTTVTESSTTPTSTTTESTSSASTISGQTAQSIQSTRIAEVPETTTTSAGTSGSSMTSGTTENTTGTSGASSSPSATGSTTTTGSGTTTNTDGVYSSTTPTTTPEQTTTFPWATGGTTRILPSGEIILSESLIAYENCTTVLMQLIFNPSTNKTRTESARDVNGCKTSTTTLMISTTPMTTPTHSSTAKTTTYNWPTGGTTKILPSGEIILSESLIAYENCTTVLMQLIFNPSTNQTRTETTTDEYGCRASTSTSSKFSTTPMTTTESGTTKTTTTGKPTTSKTGTTASTSSKTTTYNWPTGGTTRILPSGEIILSESLIAYNNCTTALMQLIYNPKTNKTRTETTSDAEGCKTTTSSVYITTPISGGSTTPSPSDTTTSFQWPTGGTTRMLPSGEIIISESLIAFKNCTTILMQLIYTPRTNTTRTETTEDANGCKATSTGAVTGSPGVTSPMTTPRTTETPFTFPDSKTTQILPNGEIILSESLTAYPNCTTVLKQLIFNPATNTTRTKTSSDAQGCKATTTTKPSATTPIPPTTTAKSSSTTPVAFSTASPVTTTTEKATTPISPTTKTKSSSSGASTTSPVASSTASPVTTTTPPPTTTTSPRRRTRTTTAVPVTCPFPSNLNRQNTNRPTPEEIKESYAVGERIIHICKKYYIQELSKQPLRIYQCGEDGKWIGTLQKCVLEPGRKAEL